MKYILCIILFLTVGCSTLASHKSIEHEIEVTSNNIQCKLWWDREGMPLHYRDKDLHRLYSEIGERVCLLKYPAKFESPAKETKDIDWVPNDGNEDYE